MFRFVQRAAVMRIAAAQASATSARHGRGMQRTLPTSGWAPTTPSFVGTRGYADEGPKTAVASVPPLNPTGEKPIEIKPLPEGISDDKFQLLELPGRVVGDGLAPVLAVHGPPELWSRQKDALYGASGGIFAVFEAGGRQHKVCADNALFLNRIDGDINEEVVFDRVLLVGTVGWTVFGRPYIGGATVVATIEEQTLSRKVMVTKFKKRKGYTRRKGHRQMVTRVRIKEVRFDLPPKDEIVEHEIQLDPTRPPLPNNPTFFT